MRYYWIFIAIVFYSCRVQEEIEPSKVNEDVIYGNPSTMAEFPGGYMKMMEFIEENFQNPEPQFCVEGKIFIEFIVETNGTLSNIQIVKGINDTLNTEAIRVFQIMPKWEPATRYNIPKRVKQVAPVILTF